MVHISGSEHCGGSFYPSIALDTPSPVHNSGSEHDPFSFFIALDSEHCDESFFYTALDTSNKPLYPTDHIWRGEHDSLYFYTSLDTFNSSHNPGSEHCYGSFYFQTSFDALKPTHNARTSNQIIADARALVLSRSVCNPTRYRILFISLPGFYYPA